MKDRPHTDRILPPSIDPETRKLGIRSVRAENAGGTKSTMHVRDFPPFVIDEPDTLGGTNEGPSPLEMAIASLASCEVVIINGVAEALGFEYSRVTVEATGQVDLRGPKGVKGVRPYFETVEMAIEVATDESPERFETLRENVEYRCPVLNLMRGADVDVKIDWQQTPS